MDNVLKFWSSKLAKVSTNEVNLKTISISSLRVLVTETIQGKSNENLAWLGGQPKDSIMHVSILLTSTILFLAHANPSTVEK